MEGSRNRVLFSLCLALLVTGSGCEAPDGASARIGEHPDGFAWEPNYYSARRVLPDRRVVRQSGYFTPDESRNSIVITEYEGPTTPAEIESARADAARRRSYRRYGPVQELQIDDRPALGWVVTPEHRDEPPTREVVAVVAYADRTYTIEFHAADERFRDPEAMRRTVRSFHIAVGPGRYVLLLAVLLVTLGGSAYLVRKLRRLERSTPLPHTR